MLTPAHLLMQYSKGMKADMRRGIPEDVAAINRTIREFLNTRDENGRPIGQALGVYAFYDYDEEPIYVGQTEEGLRSRIGRHMTNQ